jgi:hypothetical protein
MLFVEHDDSIQSLFTRCANPRGEALKRVELPEGQAFTEGRQREAGYEEQAKDFSHECSHLDFVWDGSNLAREVI